MSIQRNDERNHARTEMRFQDPGGGQILHPPPWYKFNCTRTKSTQSETRETAFQSVRGIKVSFLTTEGAGFGDEGAGMPLLSEADSLIA